MVVGTRGSGTLETEAGRWQQFEAIPSSRSVRDTQRHPVSINKQPQNQTPFFADHDFSLMDRHYAGFCV